MQPHNELAEERSVPDKGASLLLIFIVGAQLFPMRLGFLDSAVSFASFGVFVWWAHRLDVRSALAVALAVILLAYAVCIMLFQSTIDPYVIARAARFALSAMLLALLVPAAPGGWRAIVGSIRLSIYFHAAAIVVELLVPQARELMAPLVGVPSDRVNLPLRAFGLSGSYDLAGMMLCVGMLIAISHQIESRSSRYVVESVLLWSIGLFTGRTFWVAGSALLAIACAIALVRGHGAMRFATAAGTAAIVTAIALTFGPLLLLSLFPEQAIEDRREAEMALRSAGYYSGTAATLRESLRLPNGTELIFGSGSSAPWTDFGYVRLLYMHGLIGTFLLTLFYVALLRPAMPLIRGKSKRPSFDLLLVLLFLITLAYNTKFLVLGSRSASELFMLLGFARLSLYREDQVRIPDPYAESPFSTDA